MKTFLLLLLLASPAYAGEKTVTYTETCQQVKVKLPPQPEMVYASMYINGKMTTWSNPALPAREVTRPVCSKDNGKRTVTEVVYE